jgi:hypothetical protein
MTELIESWRLEGSTLSVSPNKKRLTEMDNPL